MSHAVKDHDQAEREAWYRASAKADADRNGEAMYLILRPEDGPRTATGSVRGGGPYWTAESVAEPWERAQGERIDPTPAPAPDEDDAFAEMPGCPHCPAGGPCEDCFHPIEEKGDDDDDENR